MLCSGVLLEYVSLQQAVTNNTKPWWEMRKTPTEPGEVAKEELLQPWKRWLEKNETS
jgi:hypothetical protein